MASEPREFRAEIVHAAGAAENPPTAVVQVWGELDVETAPVLAEILQQVSGSSVRVVIEMSTLAFFDSSGVGTLIRAAERLRAQGGELSVRNPTDLGRRMLGILGLEGVLAVEDDS